MERIRTVTASSIERANAHAILGVGQTFSNVSEALRTTSDNGTRSHASHPIETLRATTYTDESRCPSFSFLVFR